MSRFERARGLPELRGGKLHGASVLVHKEHMLVMNSCKAQEDIYMDQEAVPATMIKSWHRKPQSLERRKRASREAVAGTDDARVCEGEPE